MKNRPRPPISITTEVAVAGRQLLFDHEVNIFAEFCRAEGETLTALLERRLDRIAGILGCERKDLRLDHDPALRIREFNERRYRAVMDAFQSGRITTRERWRRVASCYTPNANDPTSLIYRSETDHKLKTNVRGDGAQFPDRVLIKRERKRERKAEPDKRPAARGNKYWNKKRELRRRPWPEGRKLQGRGFPKRSRPHK